MTLSGHEEPWRAWRAALAGERMHHAWILAGRRGLGKARFALAAASELVGGDMAPAAHPDILVLAPLPPGVDEDGKPTKGKRNIAIGQVRQMQRRLTTRPTLGARRAVIFDAADDLETGAFNALLKSLEEPPQGTFFLLVAHRPGRLPATIRSRCRALRFAELDDAAIEGAIDAEAPGTSREAKSAAIAAAGGSPGAALDFIARELGTAQRLMARIAQQGDPDFALRGALIGEVGQRPEREQQLAVLEAARRVLVDDVSRADRGRQARIIEAHAALSRLIAQAPTANFDPTALVLEIGGLLASVADPREAAA
ncbi:MAG TPA: DNA polymerase III subunit delta' [Novosphingobium sp.]|nr:DNA polymerase III subunit delta' [Novosphingobium sp.]